MAYAISFLTDALDDMDEGRRWYAQHNAELAARFIKAVFECVETLTRDVVRYRKVYRGLCRRAVADFPYVVYFRKDVRRQTITVFGVLHQHRQRSVLMKRT